jgi:hypothetical protein
MPHHRQQEKYGQFQDYAEVPSVERRVFPDTAMDYLRGLAAIQSHTSTPIRIPDLTTVTLKQLRTVAEASALLDGQVLVSSWTELPMAQDSSLEEAGPEQSIDLNSEYRLVLMEQMVLSVGDQKLVLGTISKTVLSARYEVRGRPTPTRKRLNEPTICRFSLSPRFSANFFIWCTSNGSPDGLVGTRTSIPRSPWDGLTRTASGCSL